MRLLLVGADTLTRVQWRAAILNVRCPTCGARRRQVCRIEGLAREFHLTRIHAARRPARKLCFTTRRRR